jgi:hypothetical protein
MFALSKCLAIIDAKICIYKHCGSSPELMYRALLRQVTITFTDEGHVAYVTLMFEDRVYGLSCYRFIFPSVEQCRHPYLDNQKASESMLELFTHHHLQS